MYMYVYKYSASFVYQINKPYIYTGNLEIEKSPKCNQFSPKSDYNLWLVEFPPDNKAMWCNGWGIMIPLSQCREEIIEYDTLTCYF